MNLLVSKKVTSFSFVVGIVISNLTISNAVLAEQIINSKDGSEVLRLAQTSQDSQNGPSTLSEKADELRSQGDYKAAIETYREAEQAGEGGEPLTRAIADTYMEMGSRRDAYWEYSKLANSANEDNAVAACEQLQALKYDRNKSLPDPFFADLYANAGWQSIGDTAFVDTEARFGAYAGGFEYYLFGKYTRDNRSGIVGEFPVEYFENLGVVGVGVQKSLLEDHWLAFIAEAGRAWDLEDFGRERDREDYIAGFEYYGGWNTDYDCYSSDTSPNRLILTIGSELMYYSRYNDAWLFELDVRPGIRLIETRKSDLDAFVKLFHSVNLKENDNNYSELGLGLTWRPNRYKGFSITASANEAYFDSGDSEFNFIIELDYNINW